MNKKDREVMKLLMKMLFYKVVDNPCDIKGLAHFYNSMKSKIDKIIYILDEISCFDIPESRIDDIILELKSEGGKLQT